MRSILLMTLLAAAGVGVIVHSLPEGDAHAGRVVEHTQTIESISIDGHGLPLAQLREAMSSTIGSTVDTQTLAHDRRALEDLLTARGYLSARVAAPVVTFGPSGGVYIVFDVDRGPLFHVRSVTLEGPAWKHGGVVTLASGDEALAGRFDRVRLAAEETLGRHGKHVHVALDVTRDTADAMVDLRLIAR